jgi:ABC-type lipoprotein export system ATPase subunit
VDEPTSRLDQANAESVAAMLATAADSASVAIVCATHDPLLIECAGVQMRLDDETPDSVQGPVTGAGAGTM